MSILVRVGASIVALGLSACCTGGAGTGAPPIAVAGAPECLAFCERIVACHYQYGAIPRPVDRDCDAACAHDGIYGLAPASWACGERADCTEVWACAAANTALFPSGPPAMGLPDDWPVDFPAVPGGSRVPSPPMGPIHVAVLAYEDREPSELATAYQTALEAAGWAVPAGAREQEAEAVRFVAVRAANSVSVSIYRDGTSTYVQTMQLSALFGQ